jgi:hypothetical protein
MYINIFIGLEKVHCGCGESTKQENDQSTPELESRYGHISRVERSSGVWFADVPHRMRSVGTRYPMLTRLE